MWSRARQWAATAGERGRRQDRVGVTLRGGASDRGRGTDHGRRAGGRPPVVAVDAVRRGFHDCRRDRRGGRGLPGARRRAGGRGLRRGTGGPGGRGRGPASPAAATWSSKSEAPVLATGEVESWLSSVASEADRVLEQLERSFGDRIPESLAEGEVEAAPVTDRARWVRTARPGGEEFFESLVKKAGNLAKGAVKLAKQGIQPVAEVLPRPAVRHPPQAGAALAGSSARRPGYPGAPAAGGRPLRQLAGRWPAPPPPRGTGRRHSRRARRAEVAWRIARRSLRRRLAEAVLAPNEAGPTRSTSEAEAAGGRRRGRGPGGRARRRPRRLARQLVEASPGGPRRRDGAVHPRGHGGDAADQARRQGHRPEKVVDFVAKLLADAHQGPRRARGRPAAVPRHRRRGPGAARPGGRAAGGTARSAPRRWSRPPRTPSARCLSLPAESLAEPCCLEAAVQEAFTEAAARHFPARCSAPTWPSASRTGSAASGC